MKKLFKRFRYFMLMVLIRIIHNLMLLCNIFSMECQMRRFSLYMTWIYNIIFAMYLHSAFGGVCAVVLMVTRAIISHSSHTTWTLTYTAFFICGTF